jgi:CHASE1-domain containing sensor protein
LVHQYPPPRTLDELVSVIQRIDARLTERALERVQEEPLLRTFATHRNIPTKSSTPIKSPISSLEPTNYSVLE